MKNGSAKNKILLLTVRDGFLFLVSPWNKIGSKI